MRNQILLYLFVSALLASVLTEIIIIEKNRRSLTNILDQTAMAYAVGLASLIQVEDNGAAELDFSDEIMRDFSGRGSRAFFLIHNIADNTELARSESLGKAEVALPYPADRFVLKRPVYWDAVVKARKIRFVAFRESAREGAEFIFVVGLDKEYVFQRLEGTVEATVPALLLGLALMLFFVWIAVSRNIKPLIELEREVESISPTNMSPVTVPEVKEIAGVANTLNSMIVDIKEAFERERRFTSNVAHELRTPISEMRSLAEVALRVTDKLDEQDRKNYEDILSSAIEMQKTVTNLLTIGRCHSGQLKPQSDKVEISPIIEAIWKELSDDVAAKQLEVRGDAHPDTSITTDKDLFGTILRNLISNAVNYTDRGGNIEWKVECNGGEFAVSISNSVNNLSEDDHSHMFEPFWRKDEARSRGDDHSGLGLSLVQSLSEMLGLTVRSELTASNHLIITIAGKSS